MDFKTVCISDINTAEYNPRVELKPGDLEYETIKRSVENFSMVEPLVINTRNNRLIGGHQRLRVLKDLGYKAVEVSVVDLNETDEKILNIALNRIKGYWDMNKLSELLAEIDEAGGLSLTGFTDSELDGMNFDYNHIDDLMKEDFSDVGKKQRETFIITFTLPEDAHEMVDTFLDTHENAKEFLAEKVFHAIRGYE